MTVYKMGGKEGTEASADEGNEKVQFSVRFDKALVDQIDARRRVSKRSRNSEIELLVERQLQAEVERDQEIVKRIAQMNSTLQSNQS